jgi:hypothetical protein
MRTLACLALVVLVGLAGCRRRTESELVIAGMEKGLVRAVLLRHGATKINALVSPQVKPEIDWFIHPDRTCMQLHYDAKRRLVKIVLGSHSRGWHGPHDWKIQQKTIVKQLEMD